MWFLDEPAYGVGYEEVTVGVPKGIPIMILRFL